MIINWPIFRNPLNWVTIWSMLIISAVGLHFAWLALGALASQSTTPQQEQK
jgi:hypothetical protein